MHKALLIALAITSGTYAITPAHAGQDSLIRELDATTTPVDPNAPPTKAVGDWQVTYLSTRRCTAYRSGGRGDNQAVTIERDTDEYWIYFISDQAWLAGMPSTMVFPISRDFDRDGPFKEFTVTRVGDQRAYGLKLDAEARSYFAAGRFFTLFANLDYEEGDKGRGDTFFTVGISSALAALDAC